MISASELFVMMSLISNFYGFEVNSEMTLTMMCFGFETLIGPANYLVFHEFPKFISEKLLVPFLRTDASKLYNIFESRMFPNKAIKLTSWTKQICAAFLCVRLFAIWLAWRPLICVPITEHALFKDSPIPVFSLATTF